MERNDLYTIHSECSPISSDASYTSYIKSSSQPSLTPTPTANLYSCTAVIISCDAPFDGIYVNAANRYASDESTLFQSDASWIISGNSYLAVSDSTDLFSDSTWDHTILGGTPEAFQCPANAFTCSDVIPTTTSSTTTPSTTKTPTGYPTTSGERNLIMI